MSNYGHTWVDSDDGYDVCTVCSARIYHGVAYDREDDFDTRVFPEWDDEWCISTITLARSGHTPAVPAIQSYTHPLENTWKVTIGYTHTQVNVWAGGDGNESDYDLCCAYDYISHSS